MNAFLKRNKLIKLSIKREKFCLFWETHNKVHATLMLQFHVKCMNGIWCRTTINKEVTMFDSGLVWLEYSMYVLLSNYCSSCRRVILVFMWTTRTAVPQMLSYVNETKGIQSLILLRKTTIFNCVKVFDSRRKGSYLLWISFHCMQRKIFVDKICKST
jgi:hypothetical protein